MPTGIIKKIASRQDFGFVRGEQSDWFFHSSDVLDGKFNDLREGQTVSYELLAAKTRRDRTGQEQRVTNIKVV